MQGKEYELVNQLAFLLRKNGDRILNGESKLSLTTQSLSLLNVSFRRYSDAKHGESSRTKRQQEFDRWKVNVQYLHDFITKTVSLKITQSTSTMQGPILMARFRSVEVLELKKVPIHMLEGLHKLRGQIKTIIVSRCLTTLQDLFEACGGDQSSPMSWPQLKSAFLSYNGLKKLDSSLRLLPALEVVDLSHNDLQRTESNLEHLTDITRINLGFNSLDTIPSFSLTAKTRIKTLVLRNNNLDNLEGIEEFYNLEELDVSENCLCDHSCLEVLSHLNKLHMLSLQGNPLSFHDSHRTLTLLYVSTASRTHPDFTLDGKKLTSSEKSLTQKSISGSRMGSRYTSQESLNIQTHSDRVREREAVSSSYTFYDSDDIATKLKVGSPGRTRSKRKKSRLKSAMFSDEDTMDSSMAEYSSREGSRVPSPNVEVHNQSDSDVPVVKEPEKVLTTKEEIQVLRDHYGDNWLQVMAAKNEEPVASSASSKDMDKTEDDIYLNESVANLTVSSSQRSETQKQDLDGTTVVSGKVKDTEDDIEVLSEPKVSKQRESSTKTNNTTSDSSTNLKSEQSFYSIYGDKSSHGSEWNRISGEECEEYYGAESEPFIVMLPSEKLQQLLVSVNNRYLIEKNLNGKVVELLDLKCLENFHIVMETVDHENIGDEISLPVCRIKFDYLRKDRRERKYVMEDSKRAQEFKELLQPFLDAKEIDRRMKGLHQCLKCSHQFDKSEAEVKIHIPDKKHIESFSELSKDNAVRYICPKCDSDMVVVLDTKELPTSLQNTPIGTPKTTQMVWSPNKDITNGNVVIDSPVAKSSPKQNEYLTNDEVDSAKRNLNNAIMSNSALISGTVKESSIQKSYSTGSAMCDMDKKQSDTNLGCPRNTSWSEVRKATDTHVIKKRTSVDSDITILTNDSSSIAVISESSNETVAEQENVFIDLKENKTIEKPSMSLPVVKVTQGSSPNLFAENVSRKLAGISEEVKTPVGSPLSSSICSSMVSSIYENTLTSPSNENLNQQTGDYQNCDNGFHDNNNGNGPSIYDMFKGNDNQEPSQTTLEKAMPQESLDNTKDSIPENENSSKGDGDVSVAIETKESVLSTGCDIDYMEIDHKLKLYLTIHHLEENEEEKLHMAAKVDIVQYMDLTPYLGYLVISTERVFIFKFLDQSSDDYDTCLNCIENQPITELQYIDIGLGYQSVRFEFSTDCSSYTFLIRDERRCKHFINLVTSLVQSTAFSENSKLEGISKFNAETIENLTLTVTEGYVAMEEEPFKLVRYVCGMLVNEGDETKRSVGIAVTEDELILLTENYQWPLPRLQAPLGSEVKGQQFTIMDRQKINNIASVETCEDDTTQIRFTFFNEESQEEVMWHISMVTDFGVLSLVNAIREPWENEYGVDLDITPVSFSSS